MCIRDSYKGTIPYSIQLNIRSSTKIKNDGPIEFLTYVKGRWTQTGNQLTYQDKVNSLTKYCEGSAAQWYTIIQDQVTAKEDFV